MNRKTSLWILIVLTLIGLADAIYLAQSALTSTALVCDIALLNDCNTVAQSPYSRFLGIPLGLYGAGFYAAILVILLALERFPSRLLSQALVVISTFGALASVYFLYLQLMVIKAVCIYCLLSAIVSFLVLGLSLLFFKKLIPCPPAVVP